MVWSSAAVLLAAESGEYLMPELVGELQRRSVGVSVVTMADDGVPAQPPDAKNDVRGEAIGTTLRARAYVPNHCAHSERRRPGCVKAHLEARLDRLAA